MTLGELIRRKRKEKNLSVYDLSRMSTLSTTMIYRLEANKDKRNGKPPTPYIDTIEKLAVALGMTVDEISACTGKVYGKRPELTESERQKKNREWSKKHQEENVGVKINIPVKKHEKLKKAARLNGTSVNKMVVSLVDEELKKKKYDGI